MNDLKFAVRQLVKNPGFTVVAVVTLALGIGANLALFTALYDQFLRPKQVVHPETLWRIEPADSTGSRRHFNLSQPYYDALRRHPGGFDSIVGARSARLKVRFGDGWQPAAGVLVSTEYFGFLGVSPVPGRGFVDGDGELRDVAVISHRLWQERFRGDREVVGKTLTIQGEYPESIVVEVVGVAPRGFVGPGLEGRDLVLPLAMESRLTIPHGPSFVLGRLKAGVSVEAAADALAPIVQEVTRTLQSGSAPLTLRGNTEGFTRVALVRAGYGRRPWALAGQQRDQLLARAGLAGAASLLVLLIAGANLSWMFVTRGLGRGHELATRLALGATRWSATRPMWLEGILLGSMGAGAALLVMEWANHVIPSLVRIFVFGGDAPVSLAPDIRVLAVALTGGVLVGFVFSLVPALHLARLDPIWFLRGSRGRGEERFGRKNPGRILVVGQIATALTLLTGTLSCLRALTNRIHYDRGVDIEHLLVAQADLEGLLSRDTRYIDSETRRVNVRFLQEQAPVMAEELRERLGSIPGVEVAGVVGWSPPFSVFRTLTTLRLPEHEGREVRFHVVSIGADCFRALGIPIVEGREVTAADVAARRRVAIVNESFRWEFWPEQPAVGQRVFDEDREEEYEVVGVVRDARIGPPDEPLKPTVFFGTWASSLHPVFLLRTKVEPKTLVRTVAAELAGTDRWLRQSRVQTGRDLLLGQFRPERNVQQLVGELAILALGLTMLGAFGVVSYRVSQRSREIGIRLALGSPPAAIARLVLASTLTLTLTGVLVGLPGAFGITRLLRHFVEDVTPMDLSAYAMASALVVAAVLLACWFPARRATRVDPMQTLRCE